MKLLRTLIAGFRLLDSAFARVWSYPLRFLNRVTGRSNFDLAYGFLYVGVAIIVSDFFFRNSITLAAFFTFCWLYVAGWLLRPGIQELERAANKSDADGVIALPKGALTTIRTYRLIYTFIVPLPTFDMSNVGLVIVVAALYFATDVRPPCKTVFRVAFDKTKEKLGSLSWQPQPQLIPIPTR